MTDQIEYKGFVVHKHKPGKKTHYRIYDKNGNFKQTSSSMKNAKRLINFCLDNKVWEAQE